LAFAAERAPGLRALSDPSGAAYRAWGLKRGNAAQLFGPAVWVETAKASLKGEAISKVSGDPFQMPGTFTVSTDGIVRYAYYSLHAGDYPGESRLMKAIEALAAVDKQG
jgi:hypothetical protein